MADQAPEQISEDLVLEKEKLKLEREKQQLDLWAKYEDIAMHFNDLTLRLRLQALAGVGASTLIAGSIFTHQGQVELRLIGGFLVALAMVWAGIYVLDVYYYQALLKGAVRAITALEPSLPGTVNLSRTIEAEVNRRGGRARLAFYGITFLLLLVGGGALILTGQPKPATPVETSCVRLCRGPCPDDVSAANASSTLPPSASAPSASTVPSSAPTVPAPPEDARPMPVPSAAAARSSRPATKSASTSDSAVPRP